MKMSNFTLQVQGIFLIALFNILMVIYINQNFTLTFQQLQI